MPELPEVETVVRSIRPDLVGRTISGVWLDWEKGLKTPDVSSFHARIAGQSILEVNRRAKYIVIKLSADWLLIHLKMTGRLYVVPNDTVNEADRWMHFRFQLDNAHQLRFSDARKFGTVQLTADLDSIVGHLGPEPLNDDFTLAILQERLSRRSGMMKSLLLNQEFVAGVGNIYADEVLHRAHIHPRRKSDSLTEQEIYDLHASIRWVLEKGIERSGATIGWYRQPDGSLGSMQDDFYAYDRTGEACRTCGQGMIEKIVVGQRGTHYCPACQK
jgi:formamidopyrimidine-DNA glycosylase